VRAYDPIAGENVAKLLSSSWQESRQLVFCKEQYEALDTADGLLLVTEWKQFRNPDFRLMRSKLRAPVVFDGRNQYDPADMATMGFEYYGIGRGGRKGTATA
jgi:UDPglucose 6-dehydrogenase